MRKYFEFAINKNKLKTYFQSQNNLVTMHNFLKTHKSLKKN